MERFDFTDLTVGSRMAGAACIETMDRRTTRTGKAYITATIRNATGQADAKAWTETVPQWDGLGPGDPVSVSARVEDGWRDGAPELVVEVIDRLPDDHPIALELHPISAVPRDQLVARFDRLVDAIARPEARILLDVVLDHRHDGVPVRDLFMTAPAAKMMHHSHLHGLLEHSCETAEAALQLAQVPPYREHVDESLVVVSALLHDVGKILEYEWGPRTPIGIGHHGRLRSHLCSGSELVALAVRGSYALPAGAVLEEDLMAVQHVIESHHGEYGSAVQPRFLEAMAVHLADMCSSKMRPMLDAILSEPTDSEGWVHPKGWKRHPVWQPALARQGRELPVGSNEEGDADPTVLEPAAPAGSCSAALLIPAAGGIDA